MGSEQRQIGRINGRQFRVVQEVLALELVTVTALTAKHAQHMGAVGELSSRRLRELQRLRHAGARQRPFRKSVDNQQCNDRQQCNAPQRVAKITQQLHGKSPDLPNGTSSRLAIWSTPSAASLAA